MRKLKLTTLYFFILGLLYYAPKPEKLTQIETYESKMRKTQLDQTITTSPIANFPEPGDTTIFDIQNP